MTALNIKPFVKIIRSKLAAVPDIGIVCGSGLSNIASLIKNPIVIPYSDLGASFPHSAVAGHANEIVAGYLGSKYVMAFRGRFHYYEGWTVQQSTVAIRLMAALGCRSAIITNAAGGLDMSYQVGDVMIMDGHINFLGMTGTNPLIGANDEAEGPRFPPISAYDNDLIAHFENRYEMFAKRASFDHTLRKGCYVGLSGPNYESQHEVQALRTMGGHAVGMSTTNEIVVACHVGLKVLGLSLITNSSIGTQPEDKHKPAPNHAEVIEETKRVEQFLQMLIEDYVDTVDLSKLPQSRLAEVYSAEKIGTWTFMCPWTNAVSSCPVACPFTWQVLPLIAVGAALVYNAYTSHCSKTNETPKLTVSTAPAQAPAAAPITRPSRAPDAYQQ